MIDTNLLFTLAAACVTAFLGLIILLHNRQGVANKIFIVHSFVGTIWAFVNYGSLVTPNSSALFWIRLVIFFAVPHVFLFFLFVQHFPDEKIQQARKFWATVVLILLMMTLAISPFVFSGLNIDQQGVTPIPGPLIFVFTPTLVIFFIASIWLVVKKYFATHGITRRQWLTIGLGLIISYTLLIALVFLRVITLKDTTFVPYSPLFLLPIFIASAYAILRHHLFNIKIIATETLVFALLVTSFTGIIISPTGIGKLLGVFVTLAVIFIGISLIRSVLREVEQKELLAKLNDELGVKNTRLTDLDRQKNEFLRVASHDLKSPVGLIKQWATLIDDGTYKDPAKVHETLEKIKSTADRSIQSVDDILDVNKIEEGRMDYTFEVRDIVPFVKGIAEDYAPLAKAQKNITVTFESPVKSANVKMDTTRLRQVIQNLMSNSFKYSEKGWIKVILTEEQKSVLIAVKDSGLGMSQELLPLLFEQFRRDPGVEKKIQGTGLGLYISKLFTVAHGGEIWAESEGKGMGSTFFVRLPKA